MARLNICCTSDWLKTLTFDDRLNNDQGLPNVPHNFVLISKNYLITTFEQGTLFLRKLQRAITEIN